MQAHTERPADQVAYRIRSAAKQLDCSERQIYNLIEAGRLRIVKVGRMSLIPASDLRALVEAA